MRRLQAPRKALGLARVAGTFPTRKPGGLAGKGKQRDTEAVAPYQATPPAHGL